MTTEDETAVVGVRAVDELFAALEELSMRRRPWTAYEQGMLESYRWAVGAQAQAPVTADEAVGSSGPGRAQLLAECQAAAVQVRVAANPDADRALGAYAALAWLCGHHDERP
ncbi:hypothetical protein [Kitasatospora purpeofusca]|uniref:hypothetical protein n=1 Tax=Kitasatospora purpeofusca TaxID=67352 RepID=UPI0036C05D14